MDITQNYVLRIGEWSFRKRWRTLLIPIIFFILVCDYHKWLYSPLNWQVSLPFILLGECIRVWSVGIRDSNLTLNILVTAGPYAYVRNPSYLGSFLIGLGIVVMSGLLWFIPIYIFLFFIGYQPMILWEEDRLRKIHGDTYLRYKGKVRRWIPSITPYPHKSPHDFLFFKAFKRERDMIMATAGLTLLMTVKYFGVTTLLQYLIY